MRCGIRARWSARSAAPPSPYGCASLGPVSRSQADGLLRPDAGRAPRECPRRNLGQVLGVVLAGGRASCKRAPQGPRGDHAWHGFGSFTGRLVGGFGPRVHRNTSTPVPEVRANGQPLPVGRAGWIATCLPPLPSYVPHGSTHFGRGLLWRRGDSKVLNRPISTLSRQECVSGCTLASANSQGTTGQ